MRIIKAYELRDNSIHTTIQQADRKATNNLCSGRCSKFFEDIANKNTLEIRNYFVDNFEELKEVMFSVKELVEIQELYNTQTK